MTSLTAAGPTEQTREQLGARQYEVLAALLAGVVPAGFEPTTTAVTGLVLRRKRWRATLGCLPQLRRQPGAAELFDRYARSRRRPGCAHEDVAEFLDWATDQNWPPATQLRRYWQVQRGERRAALVRLAGGRLLVLGVGAWMYEWPIGGRTC